MTIHEAYAILGVSPSASATEIKAAYRRRVNETHPDKGGDPAEFIRVRAAYEILMAYLSEAIGEEEAPLPPELRAVIDEIVRLFRAELAYADQETARWLDWFHAAMFDYVEAAPRRQLRQFGTYFATSWNRCLSELFAHFNGRCDAILARYENWFEYRTFALRKEVYRQQVKNIWKTRRFWLFVGTAAAVGALGGLVQAMKGDIRGFVTWVFVFAAGGLLISSLDLYSRRPSPRKKVQPLDIVPYRIEGRIGFAGSEALREGRAGTVGVGTVGLILGDILTTGVAGPIVGGLIGWTIGELTDRITRPTPVIRAAIMAELDEFMRAVKPDLRQYVLRTQQQLLNDIRTTIITNYQDKMRQTVRLLTSGG